MSEMRDLLWTVIDGGVRPVLRRHRFKRPGGGSRFIRERAPLRQVIACRGAWQGRERTATLECWIDQRIEQHTVWSLRSPKFAVDLIHGDPRDAAVSIAHWLETTAIPELDKDPDLHALAQAFEARPRRFWPEDYQSARVWELLGYPEEAARAAQLDQHDPPF
jgi:hypothetical protein